MRVHCSGGARTPAEAQEHAAALVKAGAVLQFHGMVYLRPQDVTEMVYKVRGREVWASTPCKSKWECGSFEQMWERWAGVVAVQKCESLGDIRQP